MSVLLRAPSDAPWAAAYPASADLFAVSPPASSPSFALGGKTPPATSGPQSFAAIQAEERSRAEQAVALQEASKRTTFADLIEQDRLDNEKRSKEDREKEAFEAWFENESRKVQSQMSSTNDSKRPTKSHGNRGRGRGKGALPRADGDKDSTAQSSSHVETASNAKAADKPKGRRGGNKGPSDLSKARQSTNASSSGSARESQAKH